MAHPRVRGDVLLAGGADAEKAGSPPRARGRQPDVDCLRVIPGLTPACAGTSDRVTQVWVCGWAHPRVRGDVRLDPRAAVRRRGLTPACAGTSARVDQAVADAAAHPRVRGDVDLPLGQRRVGGGSPPRARGRRRDESPNQLPAGLTPACAGTSPHDVPSGFSAGAHPRVRGDVLRMPRLCGLACGLTPACAGTSSLKRRAGDSREGSPPRARGRRRSGRSGRPGCGGSPPRARGRPRSGRSVVSLPRAHPRVRGDVTPSMQADPSGKGSPPRARGRRDATAREP